MNPKIFWKLSYGLYVVTSKSGERLNGQIANTVFQISSDPYIVGICLNKNNLTREFVDASKVFAVSVLPLTTPLDFIGHFGFKSGRDINKFAEVPYKTAVTGAPLITEHTLGFFEAEVINQVDVATHTLFIGKVINAEVYSDDEPMTYAQYHLIKKGSKPAEIALHRPVARAEETAKAADTSPAPKAQQDLKTKYACQVCGYVYDPEKGDGRGAAPGTAFADLPDDWACPICGVGKEHFAPVD